MAEFVLLRGMEAVRGNLTWLVLDFPREIDGIVGDFTKEQRRKLKSTPYPPKLPDQKYVRTGNLANRWRAEKLGDARWMVANSADYAAYVVGPRKGEKGARQAWMHKGRWWIAEEVVAEDIPDITEKVRQRIEERFDERN